MPKVSFVITVRNGEAYLKECIDSVLNQTFTDFECIILNNGSTDRTPEILNQYTDPRLRIIHQENIGISPSLNKGVHLSESDLIARLDADDLAFSQRLEKQAEFMAQTLKWYFADGDHSICTSFENHEGNIIYDGIEHSWLDGKCCFCGASKNYARGDELESHAYQFIHTHSPGDFFNMKFDVIIGNPPYHLKDAGKTTGSSPIYQLFVDQAKRLNPRYLTMIIPSRWFAGGKGLDKFRNEMLNDDRISSLVDYPITADVFPGLKVIGGVCYFLWENNHNGDCQITTVMGGNRETIKRPLNQYDTFVRFNKAIPILGKVENKNYFPMSDNVSKQKPFGLRTYERPTGKGKITLYARNSVGSIEESAITSGNEMVNKWKVIISMGYGEGGEVREYPRMIIGRPIVAAPPSACTETYIVIGTFDNETEARNLDIFLRGKFARFLVSLRKNTQHIRSDRFKFVPNLPMDKVWTDDILFDHFQLSDEEISFIDTLIRPMEFDDA